MSRIALRRLTVSFLLLPGLGLAPAEDEIAAKVDAAIRPRVEHDRFSGAVLIARDGKVLLRQGYGLANREHNVPNTPETRFRLGSITKQFTAMAVLILQEQGKLDVREKVKKYLADAPGAWDEVTVHHLLTHTSGIPSFTDFPDYLKTMTQHTTAEELVARFRDKPLEFPPGTRFKYSNSGYVLLGRLIEKVSDESYEGFLRRQIFTPLKMKDTGFDNPIAVIPHRAAGYARRGPFVVNALYIDMSIPHAAGALYSTVDDLYLWDQALDGETLIPRKSLDGMFTPEKDGYGYGWAIGRSFGRRMVGHGGGINGFATDIRRFPDDKVCVIVLSNLEAAPVAEIGDDLAAIVFDEPVAPSGARRAITLDAKVLDSYVGRYDIEEPKRTLTITRDGDQLSAQLSGQEAFPIYPESAERFFYKVVNARITFVKDESGQVRRLILHQNGRDVEAKRRAE
jgi:CubicO group peptidase (beta-lactamase class C family)